jgi:hypothetical protein
MTFINFISYGIPLSLRVDAPYMPTHVIPHSVVIHLKRLLKGLQVRIMHNIRI